MIGDGNCTTKSIRFCTASDAIKKEMERAVNYFDCDLIHELTLQFPRSTSHNSYPAGRNGFWLFDPFYHNTAKTLNEL